MGAGHGGTPGGSSKFEFQDLTNSQGNKQTGFGGNTSGGFPDINFEDEFNMIAPGGSQKSAAILGSSSNFPKPPEKTPTPSSTTTTMTPTVTSTAPTKKPLNFGSLTGLDLGQNKPASSTVQMKPKQATNYDAFNDLSSLNQGSGGLGTGIGDLGMTFGGNSGMGGFGMGTGQSGASGMGMTFGEMQGGKSLGNTSGGYGMGSTINSQYMNTNDLMSGFGNQGGNNLGSDMGLTFGQGMGGSGMNLQNDPFSRGMDGLMSSNYGNLTFGGGNGLGGGMNGVGGSSNLSSSQQMDLGTFGNGGNSNFGNMTFGNNLGQMSSPPQKQSTGGILSNPNLTFKNPKDSPKPAAGSNFNEFDLL